MNGKIKNFIYLKKIITAGNKTKFIWTVINEVTGKKNNKYIINCVYNNDILKLKTKKIFGRCFQYILSELVLILKVILYLMVLEKNWNFLKFNNYEISDSLL